MIQFNLLPDIKLTYIKARRTKHLVIVTSIVVGAVSLVILILLYMGVAVFQKKHLSDLTRDIKTRTSDLQSTADLDKMLTVQNQISSLTTLHQDKPVTSRLFTYIPQITPNAVSIQKLDLDYKQSTINLTGNADAISTINKFVDTLKFTKYATADKPEDASRSAFSKVVLGSFSLNPNEKDPKKKATYQISLSFDATIFDDANGVNLVVPKITSTRSETEKPNPVFDKSTTTQTPTTR